MPHQRKCTKSKAEVTHPSKRITLPISLHDYQQIVADRQQYRRWIDTMIALYPELFPQAIAGGYTLHDQRSSSKLTDICLRRICLRERTADGKKQVFTIAPSGVLPYQVGYTDAVDKALFLRRFGVPFWGLSYVFGRDDDYWYRLENHLGRYGVVQTTVFTPARLPEHLLADEKVTWLNGQEVVIATTVADDCVLGASIALHADAENLTEAYQHFKAEALQLKPDYAPKTVNTDGWAATQKAWLSLFPMIVIIECFLHAFLKIRERCRSLKATLNQVAEQVWEVFHAPDACTFRERAKALGQWAEQNTTAYLQEAILKLCAKSDRFALAYAYPQAHRTSTMLDRHMDCLARCLESARYYHGHWTSAERSVRAWALLHNFGPYCPRSKISEQYRSAAHKLNGLVYHENWLHNLLIATSMSGISG
jgi:hypothetical protein